jgi:hypothetical protein
MQARHESRLHSGATDFEFSTIQIKSIAAKPKLFITSGDRTQIAVLMLAMTATINRGAQARCHKTRNVFSKLLGAWEDEVAMKPRSSHPFSQIWRRPQLHPSH